MRLGDLERMERHAAERDRLHDVADDPEPIPAGDGDRPIDEDYRYDQETSRLCLDAENALARLTFRSRVRHARRAAVLRALEELAKVRAEIVRSWD